ncbi:hypothetical protein HYC85_020427 [Camellia sinensis]|uniref:J domain-containing protein n=1 Tax=Camellia sinensis TaxID=4442 RepID=A0A7J7GRF6_CAMSI|nr:hypothetical protein HYC85_020427 [Camellia sinensis]
MKRTEEKRDLVSRRLSLLVARRSSSIAVIAPCPSLVAHLIADLLRPSASMVFVLLLWKWFVTSYLQFSTMLLGKKLMGKTHYDILGVREDANFEEIRTSYRSAILDSHPDKLQKTSETSFPNHESGNRFLEVQRAWEILSNSKLRVAYDSELQASRHDFVAAEDVGLEDLMVENTGEFLELFYQCRCGDYFSIDSSELEEMGYQLLRDGSKISLHISDATLPSSIILSCGSCSLQVRLLINADIKLQTNDHL